MNNTNKNEEQDSIWPDADPIQFPRDDQDDKDNLFRDEKRDEQEVALSSDKPKTDFSARAEKSAEDTVEISKNKLNLIIKIMENIRDNCQRVTEFLAGGSIEDEDRIGIAQFMEREEDLSAQIGEGEDVIQKIIEGVFNGQHMIGPDGKQYNVPANYASKSKLVEGDILKLTILPNGRFIFKQIGPIERIRIIGRLVKDSNSEYLVQSEDNRKWRILTASVTYFKGGPDDEVIILVPRAGESNWAAVENIVSKS